MSTSSSSCTYRDHSTELIPIMSRVAPSFQRPPFSSTNFFRTSSQTASESTSTPSRSKMTASGKSGLADGDPQLSALDGGQLAGTVGAVVDRGRQGLAGDVGLVLAGRGEELVVAIEAERDPVGDLEARLLARLLDRADDLAGQALAAELVIEVELERHGVAGLGLHLVALERLHDEGDVVGGEGVLLAVDCDSHLGTGLELIRDAARVESLHGRRHLRHVLAEAGAERAVVGLHPIGDELGLGLDEVELLDVELGGDDLREALDGLALGVGGDHDRLAEGLAELDLGLGAGGASQLHRAADRIHSSFELLIDQVLPDIWEVAEMNRVGVGIRPLADRLLQAGLLTEQEVRVDLVGDERSE